jgi:hypothetical protein
MRIPWSRNTGWAADLQALRIRDDSPLIGTSRAN